MPSERVRNTQSKRWSKTFEQASINASLPPALSLDTPAKPHAYREHAKVGLNRSVRCVPLTTPGELNQSTIDAAKITTRPLRQQLRIADDSPVNLAAIVLLSVVMVSGSALDQAKLVLRHTDSSRVFREVHSSRGQFYSEEHGPSRPGACGTRALPGPISSPQGRVAIWNIDNCLATAQEHHQDLLLTLGLTPGGCCCGRRNLPAISRDSLPSPRTSRIGGLSSSPSPHVIKAASITTKYGMSRT